MCANGAGQGRWSHLALALRASPGTWALLALQVAAFALVAFRLEPAPPGPFDGVGIEALLRAGALERDRVQSGEWWRLLTAAFLHGSWLHLGMNVLLGAGWCRAIERALGTLRFLGLWLGAALAASAASLLLQDVVAVGASGAIFGMVGAVMALHRRALPGWGAFLRSRATRSVVLSLAAWTVTALVADLHIDHAAHTGGLVFGALGAWVATRPGARLRDLALLLLPLAALCAAACWPRPGLSLRSAQELRRTIHEALRREDQAAAAEGLRRADAAGLAGEDLAYYHALLDVQADRLPEAARRLRPVVEGNGPLRDDARKALAKVSRVMGYRLYTGDGAAKDPEAGLRWLVEACQLGDQAACRDAARITGAPEP